MAMLPLCYQQPATRCMQRRDMGFVLGTSRIHAEYRTLPQNLLHRYLVSDPEVPRDTSRAQYCSVQNKVKRFGSVAYGLEGAIGTR